MKKSKWTTALAIVAVLIACGLMWISVGERPRFMARHKVQSIDRATMRHVFDLPTLPPSFKITRVNYRGYSLIFNGPDGPAYSNYEAVVDANDFQPTLATLKPFAKDKWIPRARMPLYDFNMEFLDYSMNAEYDDNVTIPCFVIERPAPGTPYSTFSTCVIDDRSSPSLTLYIHTRAYLWL